MPSTTRRPPNSGQDLLTRGGPGAPDGNFTLAGYRGSSLPPGMYAPSPGVCSAGGLWALVDPVRGSSTFRNGLFRHEAAYAQQSISATTKHNMNKFAGEASARLSPNLLRNLFSAVFWVSTLLQRQRGSQIIQGAIYEVQRTRSLQDIPESLGLGGNCSSAPEDRLDSDERLLRDRRRSVPTETPYDTWVFDYLSCHRGSRRPLLLSGPAFRAQDAS